MPQREPLFAGLVVDEYDNAVETTHIGDEPVYVVNDAGFRRHIPAEQVDKAVLQNMADMIEGHEDELSKAAAKMTGHDDIFSQALLENQLLNIEERFDEILAAGIPEEGRAYLGMTGFKVRINLHGELLEVVQPGMVDPGEE
jgi:hypothetical protein